MRMRTNSIESLKINSNFWTTEQSVIQNKFLDHFNEIFQSFNPTIHSKMDELLPNKVSDLENQFLCKIPSDQKILSTLKQTPSTKAPSPDGFTGLFYK